jgi:uncharacterized protein YdeI (BOF family)
VNQVKASSDNQTQIIPGSTGKTMPTTPISIDTTAMPNDNASMTVSGNITNYTSAPESTHISV